MITRDEREGARAATTDERKNEPSRRWMREGHACRRGAIANVAQNYSDAHSGGQWRILEE